MPSITTVSLDREVRKGHYGSFVFARVCEQSQHVRCHIRGVHSKQLMDGWTLAVPHHQLLIRWSVMLTRTFIV